MSILIVFGFLIAQNYACLVKCFLHFQGLTMKWETLEQEQEWSVKK